MEGQQDGVDDHALRSVYILSEYHYFSDRDEGSEVDAEQTFSWSVFIWNEIYFIVGS